MINVNDTNSDNYMLHSWNAMPKNNFNKFDITKAINEFNNYV